MNVKIIYGLLLGVLLNLPLYAEKSREGSVVINLAGKQRMLTQKMSKEALLIIKGIEVSKNRKNLKKTIVTFDITLKGLKDGNRGLHLVKTEDKEILKLLNKEIKLWNLFQLFLNKIVDGKEHKDTLKAVEIANMPLLNLMDDIVSLYEKKYTSDISPNLAKSINLAGRERMLIQKMTKELLLIANNIKSDDYLKSLHTDGSLFKSKLDELIKDKKNIKEPKLFQRVENIQDRWKEYQNIIANTELSKEGVKIFNKKEKEIVEKMSKEMMVVAKLIDSQRYQINLTQTEKLFDTILMALINGDKKLGITATTNKEIQQQLKKVEKLWREYQPIIKSVDTSQKGLMKAMEINMPLLNEMDKAVKLYESN